jgi:hypothetical protein
VIVDAPKGGFRPPPFVVPSPLLRPVSCAFKRLRGL